MASDYDEVMNEVNQRMTLKGEQLLKDDPSLATWEPSEYGLPDSIADGLGSSDDSRWHDQQLQQIQQAEAEAQQQQIDAQNKMISMWHGPEQSGFQYLRGKVDRGDLSPSDYFSMTGRIYSGGLRGSGTAIPGGDPMAGALESDPHAVRADTSGLDALDASQWLNALDDGGGGGSGSDPFAGGLSGGAQPASGGVGPQPEGTAPAGSISFLTTKPIPVPSGVLDSRPTFYGGNQTGPGISGTDRATAASMLSNDRAGAAASNQQRLQQLAKTGTAPVPTNLIVNLPGMGAITIPSAAGIGVASGYRTNSPAQAPVYYKR